jgi:hypothetical protein
MKYNYYVPFNLNIDELVSNNYPKFKPFKKEKILYIFTLINSVRSSNKDLLFESYSQLNSTLLQNWIQNYKEYLNYLINDLKVIESDNSYVIGKKSRGFRFVDKYQTMVKPYVVNDFNMRKKMKNEYNKANLSVKNLNYLTKWFDDGLEINFSKCHEFLKQEFNLKTAYPYLRDFDIVKEKNKIPINQFNRNLIALNNIDNNCYFLKRDDNILRFHSNLTNMSSVLRNAITYKGEKLYSIDVKNSQPYLSVALFDKEFWNKSPNNTNKLTIYKLLNSYLYYIMLVETPKTLINKDFKKYVNLVKSGEFYEYLAEEYKSKLGLEYADRKQVKSAVFQTLFTGNRFIGQQKAAPKKLFSELFPDVYDVFKVIKKKDKSLLPRLLQSIESYLIIDVICKRIGKELPKAPIYSIHDSIATTLEYKDKVEHIMLDEFKKSIGFEPKLSVEEWNIDNMDKELSKLKSRIKESNVA